MGLYKKIETVLLKLLTWCWQCFIFIHEMKNIWSKRKLFKNVKLTQEQKNEIDLFYKKNYGKKFHIGGIVYIRAIQENLMLNIYQNIYIQ